jgi:SAM-dependent methyltransferase
VGWKLHLLLLLAASAAAIVWSTYAIRLSSAHPILSIFGALGISIGLPFLMLGATSPLLQVWLARLETGGIPYRLYALSNLASLLALALYPTVIEPRFTLRTQRLAWCCGFAAFALISAMLTWKTRTKTIMLSPATNEIESQIAPADFRHKLLWVLLPMGAAMQLSAVTAYLTANIAAIPLLWILPLAVYLITLILAFQFPRLLPRVIVPGLLAVMLAGVGYLLYQVETTLPIRIGMIFFLVEAFIACLFCHTEAYTLRPTRSSESTLFYLLFAAGGALGSFLIGIAFPLIFSFNYDLALTILVTALLALAVTWRSGWMQRLLWSAASILLIALACYLHVAYQWDTPAAVRNFYGSLRVRQSLATHPGAVELILNNGTIQHGTQIFSPELSRTPTTYYAEDSGVGLALRLCCAGRARKIGVVGLGVGTIAAYGRAGDRIRFYEINPAVAPIAQNLFTYLRDSAAKVDIVEGDARTSLANEPAMGYDVLVIDAFSGDAIPLHLLTTEAVAVYKRHLAPGGILAFHISNQHVDLEPEIYQLAKASGMKAMRFSSPANDTRGEFDAQWMLLTDNAGFFSLPEVAYVALQPDEYSRVRLWTDDYSSLLPFLR